MARKKTVVKRTPIKIKKTRKISEEQKEKLRERLVKMRAKKKPADYKNINKVVLALPDEDTYSFKNVKNWIKETKDIISAASKTARSMGTLPQDRQKAQNTVDNKKAYIRYCEHYLKHGDWIGIFSGQYEEHKVVPRVIAMAYNPDGTPKRTVGFWYPDIEAVWTKEMESGNVVMDIIPGLPGRPSASTDKRFTANL